MLELASHMKSSMIDETDDAYVVSIDLPGFRRKDLDISVVGRNLTVAARREERSLLDRLRRRAPRSTSSRRAHIVLPRPVDVENVTADMVDDVLTVHLPKRAQDRRRHIEVAVA